jgi:hypothetical protein
MSSVQSMRQLGRVTCAAALLTVIGGGAPASIADPSLQPGHSPVSSQILSSGDDDDQGMHAWACVLGGDDDDDDFNIHSFPAPGDDDDDDFHAQFFPRRGDDDDDGVNTYLCLDPPGALLSRAWYATLLALAHMRP